MTTTMILDLAGPPGMEDVTEMIMLMSIMIIAIAFLIKAGKIAVKGTTIMVDTVMILTMTEAVGETVTGDGVIPVIVSMIGEPQAGKEITVHTQGMSVPVHALAIVTIA